MADDEEPQYQPPNGDTISGDWLETKIRQIETHADIDVVTIWGPIASGVDHRLRFALEPLKKKRRALAVVLNTPGGSVEVVERMVTAIRYHYDEVRFIIPDQAMSAGTVLAMSGDSILMDYFSCLGPIDPQVHKDGIWVPALSYLEQYRRLIQKSHDGTLTSAELVLLRQLDLAELHQYELAGELSEKLIRDWLVRYKFKDWKVTETSGTPVTDAMKEARAEAIAGELNKHSRWASHGRGINRDALRDLGLKIDELDTDQALAHLVRDYFWFLGDFLHKRELISFVHSRAYI